MEFNSINFILFFPAVTIVYYIIPHSWRWGWLLGASCFFYMLMLPQAIMYLGAVIVLVYSMGLLMTRFEHKGAMHRRLFQFIGIALPLGMLFIVKYLNFFTTGIMQIAHFFNLKYPVPVLKIIIPLGISYYTFHVLSYLIEVSRGTLKAERHFGHIFSICPILPKIIAGPIERPQNLLPQLHERRDLDLQGVADGLKLMAWGFFKKLVIADRVAVLVNDIFDKPTTYDWTHYLVAAFLFSIQIYSDFSGYSDIAVGSARVLGFRLMENFKKPYFSKTISEFWGRWHISLSTWLRDYVYIPLGGSRVGRMRFYYNLLVTFLISGIWHGANWTYIVWGAMHGMFLVIGNLTQSARNKIVHFIRLDKVPRLNRAIKVTVTFNLVTIAWVFFRARGISEAFQIIGAIMEGLAATVRSLMTLNFARSHLY